MIADIEIQGKRHAVDVRPDGDHWLVTLNGRELVVDVAHVSGRWSMLISDVGAGFSRPATSYEISIDDGAAGEQIVSVNGRAFPLTVADPRAAFRSRAAARSGGASGSGKVIAPMPGRIVKVLVEAGQAVAARQPLVIVEAMKMENELRAPRAGTVVDVRVAEGALVEAQAVLIVLE